MLSYCTIFLCIFLVGASPVEKKTSNELGARIFNGTKASLGQFPWHAGIYYTIGDTTYFQNGAIISPEWVLGTNLESDTKSALVYTGRIELNGNVGFISAGVEFLVHKPNNTAVTLIKLGSPLQFNENVKAIAIGEDELGEGIEVVVSGWGGNGGDLTTSDVLNYAYQKTINIDDCTGIVPVRFNSEMVCTMHGTQSVAGPCHGDWAGPLVSNFHTSPTLVGLVYTIDTSDCQVDSPTGYVRISYHRDWIREQTGI